MKALFFVIFLSFSWVQVKSQHVIRYGPNRVVTYGPKYLEMNDYQKLLYCAFSMPQDTLDSKFNLIFTEKYPDLLQKYQGHTYLFKINLDTLGCITNIESSFPTHIREKEIDNDLFNIIEDLLKHLHTCKKMIFKEENGEISTMHFFYVEIMFLKSKINVRTPW